LPWRGRFHRLSSLISAGLAANPGFAEATKISGRFTPGGQRIRISDYELWAMEQLREDELKLRKLRGATI
jgi:phage tail protein X